MISKLQYQVKFGVQRCMYSNGCQTIKMKLLGKTACTFYRSHKKRKEKIFPFMAMVLSVFAKSSVKEIWQNPKYDPALHLTQLTVTCSKLTIETLKQSVKYVHS